MRFTRHFTTFSRATFSRIVPLLVAQVLLAAVFLLAGCGGASSTPTPTPPLPTRIPSPTPEYNNPVAAERVARQFLTAWQENNFEAMYALTSTAAQEAVDADTFYALYQEAHREMRLNSLTYTINAQARESNRVMQFAYDVAFDTRVVGSFADTARTLRLVMDGETWRVAWSPADIFAEMTGNAKLRLNIFTPRRASIYDRNGEILADMNGRVVVVNVIPGAIPTYDLCVNTLSSALVLPSDEIVSRLSRQGINWLAEIGTLEVSRYEAWEQALEMHCNAQFDSRLTRRYLNGELAPHVIGTVGYPNADEVEAIEAAGLRRDTILGRTGIEASWDTVLRGEPGGQLVIVSPDGTILRILAEQVTQPGESVYLTLDSRLQRYAQEQIAALYTGEYPLGEGSRGGAAVVFDPNTGAVLAMVSHPSYDANAFIPFPIMGAAAAQQIITSVKSDPRIPLLNRAAQGRYPSGSVMKPITASAVADSGVYALDEGYMCVGSWRRDIVRWDWLPGGHGAVTLPTALSYSCNPYFYEAGYHLYQADPVLLPTYANRLGLGVPTGMTDIPESSGVIGTPDFKLSLTNIPWSFSDVVDMAIGQGFVEVTPLQIVRTYASIVNGGRLYRPQLVDRVALVDQISYRMTPEYTETGIRPEVQAVVQEGMCGVTELNHGTARHIFRDSQLMEIGVCGKTGTAQNPGGLDHAWFVGYAPKDNPEIVVVVVMENAGEGSAVAAPVVREIMEYYFFTLRPASPVSW